MFLYINDKWFDHLAVVKPIERENSVLQLVAVTKEFRDFLRIMMQNIGSSVVDKDCVTTGASSNFNIDDDYDKTDEGVEAVAERKYLKGQQLWLCLVSLACSLFLASLDINIVGTIIEPVASKFNAYGLSAWMTSGYNFPQVVLCLLWGRISMTFGFKSCMLVSIFVFELGSLISGLSTSMNMLIGGRVISGIGGSGIQTLAMVIVSYILPESDRVTGLAAMGMAFAVASIAGPFLGGAFATHATWRWCFYINLPIGGVSFMIFLLSFNQYGNSSLKDLKDTFRKIKEVKVSMFKPSKEFKRRMASNLLFQYDIIFVVFFCAGLTLVLIAISFGGNEYRWNSAAVITLFVIGTLSLIVSFVFEWMFFYKVAALFFSDINDNPRPLLSLEYITNLSILIPCLATLFECIAFNGSLVYLIQYFQLIWNNTPWKAGIHIIPAVVSVVITLFLSVPFTKKTGNIKLIMILGGVSSITGASLLLLLDEKSSNSKKIGTLILTGVGFACILQGSLLCSQIQVSKSSKTYEEDFIMVTTFNNFNKSLGTTLGSLLTTTTFTSTVTDHLSEIDIHDVELTSANSLVVYWTHNYGGRDSPIIKLFMKAIHNVFYLCIAIAAAAHVCCSFTSNKRVETDEKKPLPPNTSLEYSKQETDGNSAH